jgi:hypothetical protein
MRGREIANRLASINIDVPVLRPGTIGAYLLALGSVGVATALRLAIDPYIEGAQFVTFLPAVIITSLISGLGAGVFSVVLSVAAAAFFVLPPRWSFYIEAPGNVLTLLIYAVVMLVNVAAITGVRHAVERRREQQTLQASKDRLQFALDAERFFSCLLVDSILGFQLLALLLGFPQFHSLPLTIIPLIPRMNRPFVSGPLFWRFEFQRHCVGVHIARSSSMQRSRSPRHRDHCCSCRYCLAASKRC